MSNKINDDLYEALRDWLAGMSAEIEDVLSDDKGYYILVEDEPEYNPERSDEFRIDHKKVYLPVLSLTLDINFFRYSESYRPFNNLFFGIA